MQKTNTTFLPQTAAELEAMSAEEIDAAIVELRRLQERNSPIKIARARLKSRGVWGDAFGGGFGGGDGALYKIPSIAEGWAEDALNLRGDWERVGRDMWIGVLQNALIEKRG